MLSLEDGTSSGGEQKVEGTKREGPSEYEITLENKNKQVCLLFSKMSVCGPIIRHIVWDGVNADSSTCLSMRRFVKDDHLTLCLA